MNLSRLEKVPLRDIWEHEAYDFTNWLAQPENLEQLSDEIGISIVLLETEASFGSFNVDILAEAEGTDHKIIIENQLEQTDHDHLGKLITYGSGFDAKYIIWIVKSVRDEHKQAIDWLNEHTDSEINIFAIQMEVWKIADSPFAPKFQVIAKPNDWTKAIKKTAAKQELSSLSLLQLEFWTEFKEFAQNKGGKIKLRKPLPQQWYDVSIGFSDAHISLTVNSQAEQMTCEIYIVNSKALFANLFARKEEIEAELALPEQLHWDSLPERKACKIKIFHPIRIQDKESWNNSHKWMLNRVYQFQTVFPKHIKVSL